MKRDTLLGIIVGLLGGLVGVVILLEIRDWQERRARK